MSFFKTFAKFAGKGQKLKTSMKPSGGEKPVVSPRQTLSDLSTLRQFREVQNSPDRLSSARKLALADAKTARLLLKQLPTPAPAVLPSSVPAKLSPAKKQTRTNFKTSFGLASKPSSRAMLVADPLSAE